MGRTEASGSESRMWVTTGMPWRSAAAIEDTMALESLGAMNSTSGCSPMRSRIWPFWRPTSPSATTICTSMSRPISSPSACMSASNSVATERQMSFSSASIE